MGLLKSLHCGLIVRLLKIRYAQLGREIPSDTMLKKEADLVLDEVRRHVSVHGKTFWEEIKQKIKQRIS